MLVQSYLFFDGRCEEALNFYTKAIGAKVEMMMRFKESPEGQGCGPNVPPPDKVMHACVKIGDTSVMASDGYCQGKPSFQGFALSLNAKNAAEADRLFNALADGGQVQQPLIKTFFSERFGMVADRFGVSWMVVVLPQQAGAAPPH
jgi:PhnB protein